MDAEKKFYLVEDKLVSKKLKFYKVEDGRIEILFEDDEIPEGLELIGDMTYTLERPTWAKRNMIKESAVTTTLIGTSSLNPYSMNTLIIGYLLKDWSIEEKKLEFEEDPGGYQIIKDLSDLLNSDIAEYIFDGVVKIYNKYIN